MEEKNDPEKTKINQKIEDKNFDILYARRQFLDETRIKMADSFDKYLLTISTGGLYLSVIFTNSISDKFANRGSLALGWVFLILSISLTLVSFSVSEIAHKRQIEITDKEIESRIYNKTVIGMENGWNKPIETLKIASVIFFVLGIAFLGYFYFINLK